MAAARPTTEGLALPSLGGLAALPARLAGHLRLSPEGRVYVLRPLVFLLAVSFAAWLAFKSLYVGSPAFGANPVADYVGLVMSGFGAEVAQRWLQNLPRLG